MKRILFVVAGSLLLATGSAVAQSAPRNATPKEIAAIKDAMETKLKDADSAKFRKVVIDDKGGLACGMVNAKNSMGGYAGYTYFMATVWIFPKTPPTVVVLGIDTDTDASWQQSCTEKGLTS